MNQSQVSFPLLNETSTLELKTVVKDVLITVLCINGRSGSRDERAALGRLSILSSRETNVRQGHPLSGRRLRNPIATRMGYLGTLILLFCSPVAAQQMTFDSYEQVQRKVFWQNLYAGGGTTLYCGLRFKAGQKSLNERGLTIEHAYPADWIATYHGCKNRDSCKKKAYGRAAADLHNLWPALANINSSRQDQSLGEIPGEEQRRFQDYCPDYERTTGQDAIVEPRDVVKGDMARSILYMLDSYGLRLPDNMQRDMLLRWHVDDPPDDVERWRNLVINDLQGSVNPLYLLKGAEAQIGVGAQTIGARRRDRAYMPAGLPSNAATASRSSV